MASDGNEWPLRAFIDTGSQISCITENAVQMLRLPRQFSSCQIVGIGGALTAQSNGVTKFTIKSRTNEFAVVIVAAIMQQVTRKLPSDQLPVDNWPHLQKLQLADPDYGTPASVDMLLGADVIGNLYTQGFIAGGVSTPNAMNTRLGWIIFGSIHNISSMNYHTNTCLVNSLECANETLDRALRRLWELQEPIEQAEHSSQELECEKFFTSTVQRDQNGRYQVRIPFNSDPSMLGDSREIAIRQFYRMENRMARDGSLREKYTEFMQQYIDLGHMVKAANPPDPSRVYYLPHHAVINRFRVVFNASQKTTNGMSLNELQMVGPTIQPLLLHTILRFRTYRIGLAADVEKMFRQILIHPADRDLQRIFWRTDKNEPLTEYQLATVTYGMASAPFNAIRTLQQCAHDYRQQYPEAADHVLTNFYVDDYLGGADTVEKTICLKRDLDALLRSGGLILRKWRSNNWNVMEEFSELSEELNIKLHNDEDTSVLGLKWNVRSDAFCFSVNDEKANSTTTKRVMLSEVARLFDPTGFLSPVTIVGKTIIQRLWQENCGWDEQIPTQLKQQWLQLRNQLLCLNELKIPRWIGTSRDTTLELHTFCDASSIAYAAAVYAKVTTNNGESSITLVAAKAKVAPVKTISIPRLELCAAQLGAQLYHDIRIPLGLTNETAWFWSDSMVVLAWLRRTPNSLKTYVANRVSNILTLTTGEQWKHVPTAQNPADCASRGLQPRELLEHKLWWHGPPFLAESSESWPNGGPNKTLNNMEEEAVTMETRPVQIVNSITTKQEPLEIDSTVLLERYSSLQKLLRITAYCLRCIKPKSSRPAFLTIGELENALLYWIRYEQGVHFSTELTCAQANKNLNKESKLYNFGVVLDDTGILRVDGRLNRAPIPYNARHPMVIHHESRLARLLISEAHTNTIHGGTQLMLNYLRQKYWILHARKLVKQHRTKCVGCFRMHPLAQQQRMADLPSSRVTPNPPFDKTAIDYFGPILLKQGGGRSKTTIKGFVAVFVCVATKAMHLECVTGLTTEAFLATLSRFSSRRGHCSELWSDNATYFVGANNEWRKLQKSSLIPETLAKTRTKWNFIPPGSPHHGGLHEAGVRSVKAHLKHIIRQRLLSYEEISTVLARVEACLNSRPLVALHDEAQVDTMALTPGHFLIGRPLIAQPEVDLTDTNSNRLSRWQMVQRMHQEFWKLWSQDYLNTLRQRFKWQKAHEDVEIGNIVVICKENVPPLTWLMGRVINVHPGADGRVRVVSIQTKNGVLMRAVQKICVLPIT